MKKIGSPLSKMHNGRALVLEDGLVRVHANVELIAELAGLDDGAGMAWLKTVSNCLCHPELVLLRDHLPEWGFLIYTVVEKVKAAVDPEPAVEQLRCRLARRDAVGRHG